jgi:hypothetical protein
VDIRTAAAEAGMDCSSVYKALKRPTVRQFFFQQLEPVKIAGRAAAVHTLLAELKGPNAAARVGAARVLLESEDHARLDHRVPGSPGLVVVIGTPGAERGPVNPPREVTISTPRTIAAPVRDPEPVSPDDRGEWWRDAALRRQ